MSMSEAEEKILDASKTLDNIMDRVERFGIECVSKSELLYAIQVASKKLVL